MTGALELIRCSSAVLLDFDGPVTPLMPAPVNAQVADAARQVLLLSGLKVPSELRRTTDHLAVLRYTWAYHREHVDDVETACVAAEVDAAGRCLPTAGAHEFLALCQASSKPVAIVSNNAAAAVQAYVDRHGLASVVRAVVGREPARPDLMKPNPHMLGVACDLLDVSPRTTVMVGDSISDVAAAHAVTAKAVGYGKTPQRAIVLRQAGADDVIESMSELTSTSLR
jgi:phosphoglycolate phosphatase-like HAD superfamily hydrolase